MKKLLMMLALSLVMIACNKEEDNDQLIGWDKMIAEVGQTEQSAVEVFQSLTEDEIWVAYNVYGYSKDKNGNIIELKVIENGSSNLFPGPDYCYRMPNNDTILKYCVTNTKKLGEVFYTRPYKVQIESKNLLKSILYDNYGESDKVRSIEVWKIVAYDENQILIESTLEYQEPLYDYNGEILSSDETYLYSLIQLVRCNDYASGDWKDAMSEKEYYDLKDNN